MKSRRAVQKTVAESRAPVFARPPTASTPTGLVPVNPSSHAVQGDTNQNESWPGPFAVARDIMSKREEAKRKRDDEIANGESKEHVDADYMDEYDKFLKDLKWSPMKRIRQNYLKVPSLMELCVKACISFPNLSIDSLLTLSEECRHQLLFKIAEHRQLSIAIAIHFILPKSMQLTIPECSLLTDEFFVNSLNCVLPEPDEAIDNDIPSINMIQLWNAGFGFTDQVAKSVLSHVSKLEIFKVTGLYRLSDESLAALLTACNGSLKHLDLTSNSRLNNISCQSIRLDVLISLSLDFVSHLTDDHLVLIGEHLSQSWSSTKAYSSNLGCSSLQELSLCGLIHVTDNGVETLISRVGISLHSLSLGHCSLLTDKTLVAIRNHCHTLLSIDISDIPKLTTEALIGLFILHPDFIPTFNNTNNSNNKDSLFVSPNYTTLNMTAELVKAPVGGIGRLEVVNLKGLLAATDDVINHLAQCGSHTLRHLVINGCATLTSKSLIILSRLCNKSLQFLDLSFVRKVSPDSLGYFIDSTKSMKEIHLWGCTQFHAEFYQNLSCNLIVVGRQSWIR